MSRNILFISVQNIKERTSLHANIDEKLILPEILTCQDMFMLPALGSALYNRIQDGIVANNLNANEITLLDTYLAPTLVYFVMSEMPQALSYQFYNKGLLRKSGENTENPSMQDMIDVANRYKARAEFYKQRMIKYLKEYSTLYPEYLNPGSGIDAIHPENDAYTTSIWLGDFDCCAGKSFEELYQGNRGCSDC